jgi:hypothetical protein
LRKGQGSKDSGQDLRTGQGSEDIPSPITIIIVFSDIEMAIISRSWWCLVACAGKVYQKIMEVESRLLPCGLHTVRPRP